MSAAKRIVGVAFALIAPLVFGQTAEKPEYYDEPQFTVAGMTDYTYRGGHGSDVVLQSSEELTKATAALGNVDREQGAALELVRKYQRAAESSPTEANLFNLGAELLTHHADDAAIKVFSKGNRSFPRSSRMLLGLGAALYAQGEYDKAAQLLFQAADLNPRDPEAYLFLGKVQAHEITSSQGYRDRMRRFAELAPHNPWANYYYAVALVSLRTNEREIERLLNKATALNPRFAAAYLELGILCADQKKLPAAISAYQKAIELDPQLEEAHYRLSQALALQGEKAEAEKELALYRELSKKSAEQRERERAETKQFVIALKPGASSR